MADLTAFFVLSVGTTNGSLTFSEHRFNKLAPYFTGLGLLSKNKDLCKGCNKELIFSASFKLFWELFLKNF